MQSDNTNISPKTWMVISRKNLLSNFQVFGQITEKKTKIMAVVKANAYGHGFDQVVSILKNKADWFGVDSLQEALAIRNLGIDTPILILGYVSERNVKFAIEENISFVVYGKDILKTISKLKLKNQAKLHLKIETGLNRQGVYKVKAEKLAAYIVDSDQMLLEGVSTHFADIEDTIDSSFAKKQLSQFNKVVHSLKRMDNNIIFHCAASAAALLYKNTHFDMIRAGMALYGLWPSKETRLALSLKRGEGKVELKPVLTWISLISHIKKIKRGSSVGYGRTWYALRDSVVGIVSVGYYDGYDRCLSNNSFVLIKDQYIPVIGRVAMNMIILDLTEAKSVKSKDKVVLMGRSGSENISVESVADKIGTINYEVVARINPRIPRLIV